VGNPAGQGARFAHRPGAASEPRSDGPSIGRGRRRRRRKTAAAPPVGVLPMGVAPRASTIERNTKETQIRVELALDGSGARTIDTPVPFLSHMLDAFAKHGVFDLVVRAAGDVQI